MEIILKEIFVPGGIKSDAIAVKLIEYWVEFDPLSTQLVLLKVPELVVN